MPGNEDEPTHALTVERAPVKVIAEAKNAAKMLHSLIDKKEHPVIINGKRYLAFEDWQLLGHFYGLSVRVSFTERIEVDGIWGWKAGADVYHIASDRVVSSAEAICLYNEKNWIDKPSFQVASMAETRACAKAFRNCLSWVVVLAGFAPETAEETPGEGEPANPAVAKTPGKKGSATPAQIRKIWADAGKMSFSEKDINGAINKKYGVKHVDELTVPQASWLIDAIARGEIKAEELEPDEG